MNEQDQFLKDLEVDETADPFQPETPVVEKPEEGKEEDDVAVQKERDNREARRAKKALAEEREANIVLNTRLQVLSEVKNEANGTSESLKTVDRLFGTDTPENLAATELLKTAFKGMKEEAVREAIETIREERAKEQESVKQEEKVLDSMLEELEDEYNIDLTSPSADTTRKAFFRELERMSPKDSNGNVLAYADHLAVFESLQSKSKKPENRAKDLASRTMTRSGASADSTLVDDAGMRFLKENGII